jgi:hypothetical protein
MDNSIYSTKVNALKYINSKTKDYNNPNIIKNNKPSDIMIIQKKLLMDKILSIDNLSEIENYIKNNNSYPPTINLKDDLINIIQSSPIEIVLPFNLSYSDDDFYLYNNYLKKNGDKLLKSYKLNNRIVKKKPIPYFKLGNDSINRELDGRENNRYVDMVSVNKHNRFLC